MRLTDLNPELEGTVDGGHLSFDCPLGHPHRITIPIGDKAWHPRVWASSGAFPETLTLTPSIHAHEAAPNDQSLNHPSTKAEYDAAAKCGWHGHITNGEAVQAA